MNASNPEVQDLATASLAEYKGDMANLPGPRSRTRRRSKSSLRRTSASFAAEVVVL